jgi:very-short-patch-repair endonuclease
MSWVEAFEAFGKPVLSRAELISLGATGLTLTAGVRGGHLVRARRDHYVLPGTSHHLVEATRIGGRLACVSVLDANGIFAFNASKTHVHMVRTMSRSRSPRDRFVALTPFNRHGVQLHWQPLFGDDATEFDVGVLDVLAQSLQCQEPLHALASIDNALHQGFIQEDDLSQLFSNVPARLGYLRGIIDGRAESGQETVLRRIIADTGLSCEPQVEFSGVGRVDFVVAGCLVVEADSREAHDGWEHHIRDRGRDLALGALGYMSLRPAYQHTMNSPNLVRDAIAMLVSSRRRA